MPHKDWNDAIYDAFKNVCTVLTFNECGYTTYFLGRTLTTACTTLKWTDTEK